MTGPNGHASVWTWIRDKLLALWDTLKRFSTTDWLLFIACFVAAGVGWFEYAAQKEPTRADVWVLILKGVAALVPAAVLILSRRNENNYKTGLERGSKGTQKEWSAAVRGQFNALKCLAELLAQTPMRREAPGKAAISALMVNTRLIVVSAFDGLKEDNLTVSLGVPNAAKTQMKIVELLPPSAIRQEGNEYPVHANAQDRHTMTQTLMDGLPSVTPDAHGNPELRGKPYRSILCFPIKNSSNQVIAVMNIDAAEEGVFGARVGAGAAEALATIAYNLSEANLKTLAIVIHEADLYKDYRQS